MKVNSQFDTIRRLKSCMAFKRMLRMLYVERVVRLLPKRFGRLPTIQRRNGDYCSGKYRSYISGRIPHLLSILNSSIMVAHTIILDSVLSSSFRRIFAWH